MTLPASPRRDGAPRNTPKGDRLDVLVTLVEAWERKHYPFDLPDPVEAIKYHMDQNGLQPRDLIPFIGSRNRVHEVPQPQALAHAQNDLATACRARHSRGIAHSKSGRSGQLEGTRR
jgi:hypothetical protein